MMLSCLKYHIVKFKVSSVKKYLIISFCSYQGISAFYKGFIVNLFGIIPYAGINLALYETLKDAYLIRMIEKKKRKLKREDESHNKTETGDIQLDVKRPPALILLSIGTFSSSCGQVAVYPLALVRTKLQVLKFFKPSFFIFQFYCMKFTRK